MEKVDLTPYQRFSFGVLGKMLEELEVQLEGAASEEDIEFVHRSRVASRRLRAALAIFEGNIPKKQQKYWAKATKRVTKAFGQARDLDVQIDFLRNYMEKTGRAGTLQLLLSKLTETRANVQNDVIEAVFQFNIDRANLDPTLSIMQPMELDRSGWHQVQVEGMGHVTSIIDELLVLEEHVPDPEAMARHHEMRIIGKRLRYTLEIFSPAFDDRFKGTIKAFKEMQDTLGEMHDCDVWEQLLVGSGLLGPEIDSLIAEREARRRELHAQFVIQWKEMRERHLPALEALMRSGIVGAGVDELHHERIGLIADVHGNLPALQAVLRDAEEKGVESFLNAGDSVGLGPFTNETLEMLVRERVIGIRGNFDEDVLRSLAKKGPEEGMPRDQKKVAVARTVQQLDKEAAMTLRKMPAVARLQIGGKKVLLVHGSPLSQDEKVDDGTTDDRLHELAEASRSDMVIMGHTHLPFDREIDDVRFINPGSVGRQADGDPRASYAIWDTKIGTVEWFRVPYRLHETLERSAELGWPKETRIPFLRGRAKSDSDMGTVVKLGHDEIIGQCEEVARRHGQWDEHALFVRGTAAMLCRSLAPIHHIDDEHGMLLACAATMHDVGWAWGGEGHHRSSFDLIALDAGIPMTWQDRIKVAIMARYHRGGRPKPGHGLLGLMKREEWRQVLECIAILRVADGLDYGHAQRAEVRSVQIEFHKVTLVLADDAECGAEKEAALRKADMFQYVFGKRLGFE